MGIGPLLSPCLTKRPNFVGGTLQEPSYLIFINFYLQDGSLDRLSSKDFVTLARIVERFALDCEGVSGRQSHNLRGTLLTQAKRFIERFHTERLHKLR